MTPRVALATALSLCTLAAIPASALAAAPTIPLTTFSATTTTSTTLEADVNPQGKATRYHFEFGPSDCSANPCTSTPEAQIPAGTTAVRVSATIEGLTPGTAYHFRVIARHINEENGEATSPDRTFTTFQAPQEFDPCPNDALRRGAGSTLPDCRAYEQASPLNKDGGDAISTAPFTRAAADGGAITFLSLSGIPGGLGSQEFPLFLASRGADGWSTQGLLPPATTGQKAAVLGWTPDFSDVYTKALQLGEPPILNFMAAAPGEQPTSLAPYLEGLDPSFAGASADGGEVLFESRVAIPGVTGSVEGASNVYLWDRQSNSLGLAGVMNDGQAPPKGAFAGSYDWIEGTTAKTLSEGGADRHYYLQDQHAISTDGSTVFFTTAGSGQLYRRLNPTQTQSALDSQGNCTEASKACTVNLSTSERTEPDPAGARPAAFQAASADGSKVLFTSSQMLTDDANTGPEQEPAQIERSDLEGKNRKSDFIPTHATAVAVDSEHIYWVDLTTQTIARAKLDGTDIEDEFITAATNPKGLAVLAGELFWTNGATLVEEEVDEETITKVIEGTIGRAKLNGEGAATEVDQDFIEGAINPNAVTADSEHVFWTSDTLPRIGDGHGFVGRATVQGDDVEPKLVETFIGSDELPAISIDGEHLYWMDRSNFSFSTISRANLDGSGYFEPPSVNNITFIPLGEVIGRGLAIEGDHLYWSEQGPQTISRAQLNGDEPATEVDRNLVSGADHPWGLAADATNLYWSSNGNSPPNPGNDLYRYDAGAGAGHRLSDLTSDLSDPVGADVRGVLGVSQDGSYVYFVANGVPDGTVGSPNARGERAEAGGCQGVLGAGSSGVCNLYLAHDGEVRFLARLDTAGTEDETDGTNWAPTSKTNFANLNFQKTSRLSRDGQALLFRSQRQLTDYDNEGVAELYLYRAASDELGCVSCSPTGEPPGTRGPDLGDITTSEVAPTPPAGTLSGNLSADGNRVFFETTDALVAADTNGRQGCPRVGSHGQNFPACTDTYEWEAQGSGSCDAAHAVADGGCLYLISTGKGTEPQLIADASSSGDEVFFFTRSQLVGQDTDSQLDVYSARVEGGLPSQNPPPLQICEAEGCKHAAPAPPPPESPVTEQSGFVPQAPPLRCKKGFVKKRGKCVRKRHKKQQRHRKHHGHPQHEASR